MWICELCDVLLLLQNWQAWSLYQLHESPAAPTPSAGKVAGLVSQDMVPGLH